MNATSGEVKDKKERRHTLPLVGHLNEGSIQLYLWTILGVDHPTLRHGVAHHGFISLLMMVVVREKCTDDHLTEEAVNKLSVWLENELYNADCLTFPPK